MRTYESLDQLFEFHHYAKLLYRIYIFIIYARLLLKILIEIIIL